MNPISKFLLEQCDYDVNQGRVYVERWKCQDYAYRALGSNPDRSSDVAAFTKQIMRQANILGMEVR